MARYDVVTFDCYGTLVDWESGIAEAFREAGSRSGARAARADVLAAYAEIEPAVEEGAYRSYRDVLRETAIRVAARLGFPLEPERAGFLAESLPAWKPFPDTNPALRRLAAAGCRLGILSNVDDDLLAGTRKLLDAKFDPIVTAQQVRSYKPGHAHFLEARRRIPAGARWLHAAQSSFHDVLPARSLGIPAAWIDRSGAKTGQVAGAAAEAAEARFTDLTGLADWIGGG
jgi:2-haloalkanoic acid dehalogenase type II